MIDPLFWLGVSLLLVAASLTAVLIALIPAVKELARAARSAEKLFDTLNREFPPTLEAIRLTGLEISELTDDITDGVQSAGRVVKQVDQGLTGAKQQARRAQSNTRSVFVGVKTAWKTFRQTDPVPYENQLPASTTDSKTDADNYAQPEHEPSDYSDYSDPPEPPDARESHS